MPDKTTNNCTKFKQPTPWPTLNHWKKSALLAGKQALQACQRTLLAGDCLLCGAFEQAPTSQLCQACLDDLPYHRGAQCPKCALPTVHGSVCGRCIKRPPAFDHTQAIFAYTFPIMPMLQRFKYQQAMAIGHCLTELTLQTWQPELAYDGLIPMPMHPNRRMQRGFNPTEQLANAISRHTGIPVWHQHCERILDTPPQASLSLKQRLKNIRRAFKTTQRVDGQRILLLDDVMTTSASLNALATVLKSSGAARVDCLVIARTLPALQQP